MGVVCPPLCKPALFCGPLLLLYEAEYNSAVLALRPASWSAPAGPTVRSCCWRTGTSRRWWCSEWTGGSFVSHAEWRRRLVVMDVLRRKCKTLVKWKKGKRRRSWFLDIFRELPLWCPLLPYGYILCQTVICNFLTSGQVSECLDVKNYKWLSGAKYFIDVPIMASVGVKGLGDVGWIVLKVKGTILQLERSCGAHLPHLAFKPVL